MMSMMMYWIEVIRAKLQILLKIMKDYEIGFVEYSGLTKFFNQSCYKVLIS